MKEIFYPEVEIVEKELIFGLDIGTRKIAGILAEEKDAKLKIINYEVIEHESRTMVDGQVHNIIEVAKVVREVKTRLEKQAGCKLKKVGVAVAGRTLRTFQKRLEKRIPPDREITKNDILNLEFEAVALLINDIKIAQHKDTSKSISDDFNCVGYSVVYYELDGMRIAELTGHIGRYMAADIIATFLPRSVIDSLFNVLHRAELEVVNLTLEPIAAINVIVPENMRKLNIVLIDIGAGTSDLAVTKNGAVVAYGMVPEAGDEITEYLCEKFLMDFNTGEKIKRELLQKAKLSFVNILGQINEIDTALAVEALRPRIRELAYSLANVIMELNFTLPQAVICVGGGALTPLFREELSQALNIDYSRIGIKAIETLPAIENITTRLKAPDMVTPLGIIMMTHFSSGLKFINVTVNNRRLHLLDINQRFDLLSVLLASGADMKKLYGRPGLALTFEENNRLRTIKGKMGKPATIKLNGKKADLSSLVQEGDNIEFSDAEDGENAKAKISDILNISEINVTVGDTPLNLKTTVLLDGKPVTGNEEIPDRAKIFVYEAFDIKSALISAGIDCKNLNEREIVISVDNEPRVLTQSNFTLKLNGKSAGLKTILTDGDKINFDAGIPAFCKVADVVQLPLAAPGITVNLNKQKYSIVAGKDKILMNGKEVSLDEFLIDRAEIKIIPAGGIAPVIVSHVFPYLAIDLEKQRGKILKIFVDGKPAGFTTPLNNGSQIEVYFEPRETI
ncbi:MAG: cell division protein FtsA [Candidatus Omnitrophota bacterium]